MHGLVNLMKIRRKKKVVGIITSWGGLYSGESDLTIHQYLLLYAFLMRFHSKIFEGELEDLPPFYVRETTFATACLLF